MDLIEELLDYLDQKGPVIIGESATKIIEGDPMTHPHFRDIIRLIRDKYLDKIIKITTNGSYLDDDMIRFLENCNPIEVNISLNCSGPEERAFLMGDRNPGQVFFALEMLAVSSIKYNGSIVAMPHLTGWSELRNTIELMAEYSPETIRVFMPGYTKYSEDSLKFNIDDMYRGLNELVEELSYLDIPVLLEPPVINDFKCTIKDIIKNSPAYEAGLQKGDIILKVDDKDVLTRVDGFNKISLADNPVVEYQAGQGKYQSGKDIKKTTILKNSESSSGIIVDYDMSLDMLDKLSASLLSSNGKQIAIITSILGKGVIKAFLEYFHGKYYSFINGREVDFIVIENKIFAGSIMSAGLLTNRDIIMGIKESGKKYDLLILPGIIYDIFGNDLTGSNYKKIEEELAAELILIQ